MRDPTDLPALSTMFRRFALGAGRDGALRYERICAAAAEDDALLSLLTSAPIDQRRPNILLAAVHYLLLEGADEPLAGYYPTVVTWRSEGRAEGGARTAVAAAAETTASAPGDLDALPRAFGDFCARHADELSDLVASRSTQTNEIGRCSALLPALAAVADRVARRTGDPVPLALVDLGAAAGLNLLFDRFSYSYSPLPGRTSGDHDSAVRLRCEVRFGGDRIPLAMPEVCARVGLDRRPVDLTDHDSVVWLLACQWPDHLDRFRQARAATALARTEPRPPRVVEGDIPRDVARVVAEMPEDAHLCLFHSWVAAYLSAENQRLLARTISEIASTRPVSWVFAENPYEVPGLPVPPAPGAPVKEATAVVLVDFETVPGATGPVPAPERIADMHSHGRWIRWYGTTPSDA